MRPSLLRLIILGTLLIFCCENLMPICASPVLSTEAYMVARSLIGPRIIPYAAPISDTGKLVEETRATLEPVKSDTIQSQPLEDQPPQEPTDSAPSTKLMGDNRQLDALGTDSTLYAKSTIAYGQMNDSDAKALDVGVSPTAVEAESLYIKAVPSSKVVEPILYVDLTSTFSTSPGSAWGRLSDSTTSNDAGYDSLGDMPPATAPHPAMTMAKPVTTALAEIECFQKISAASNLRRQTSDDQSYGADGPPSPPPNFTPPPHPLLDKPPPPDSSCSSSSPTSTKSPQAATTSNPASSDVKPYPPSLIHCVVATSIAFVALVTCAYRKWCNAQYSPPVPVEPAVDPQSATFSGSGRTCASMISCLMKQFRDVIEPRASPRLVASFAGVERTQRPINDSVSESKTSC